METIQKGYHRLLVWKEAHEFVLFVYRITRAFPRDEMFGLISQMRRASVSIAANIVEGQARTSKKEFLQFLAISNGSLVEVEYYIELSFDLGYISASIRDELLSKKRSVGALLQRFIQGVKNRS